MWDSKKIQDARYRDRIFYNGNRVKVLERDLYACKDCGCKKDLTVHHIDKSGQSENPNNDMDNLITLCRKCHMKYHTRGGIVTLICSLCGKEYETKRHNISTGKYKHCSKECANKSKIGKLKTGFYAICLICNKEFRTTPYKISIGKGKYCSQECYQESQRKTIFVQCIYCDKEFTTIAAKLKQGRGKFCSRKCSGIYYRQMQLQNKGSR